MTVLNGKFSGSEAICSGKAFAGAPMAKGGSG